MPGDLNRVMLIGELVFPPERSGNAVKLVLRTAERWRSRADQVERSRSRDHNLVVVNPALLEFAGNLRQGDRIFAEGALDEPYVLLGALHSSLQLLRTAKEGGAVDQAA